MAGDELGGFLDREQLLGSSPARRAATLLYLIEIRTARLATQAKQRLVRPLTEESAEERALEFVEAFAVARDAAVQTSVHDLERQADRWAPLVPRNPRLQAALAHRFGEKYRFTAPVAPGIREALGLYEPEVRDAYQALYSEPVESVFVARLEPRERLRWSWTSVAKRLEHMSPFWTAYSLTLTETVGTDILALPIAMAALGPLPALVVLVALGLLNVFTVCLQAESVVRTGPMRYGNAYLGRLYESNLGARGSLPASGLLILSSFVWIPVCYVGLGRTLGGLTSVPAAVWVAMLFGVTVLYLRRGSLDATIATAVAVGAIDLVLLLGMSVLALAHVRQGNLTHTEVPFVHGHPFAASAVALVIGVTLMAYFGHLSSPTCASLVLDRDPSGRSLIRGCAGAQLTAIAVYCVFVLAVNGAVGADELATAGGTVVAPLADVAGAGVAVLGSAFVILSLGMGSVIEGLSLSWLVKERLPSGAPRIVVLPRRRARLVFRSRGNAVRVAVTYLGAGRDGSRFSVEREERGRQENEDVAVAKHLDVLPAGGRHRLALEVIEADERRARVAVTSTLPMVYEGELDGAGLDLAEVLSLSDPEAALAASLARSGEAGATSAAGRVGSGERETLAMLESLAARGIVERRETPAGPVFAARLAPRRPRRSSVWSALTDTPESSRPGVDAGPGRRAALGALAGGRSGRLLVSLLPLTAAFALSEWLVISDTGSFAGLLSFLGVIVVSLVAGLYPVLLLVASRRNGEYAPDPVDRAFGWPPALVAIYLFFLAVLVAHAAVIWTAPGERASAAAAAALMLAMPVVLLRGGAFRRRVTVEVRDDQRAGSAEFAILAGERAASGTVTLAYSEDDLRPEGTTGEIPRFGSLRRAVFELGRDRHAPAEVVKVWVHRVTPEGETESLPASARVRSGDSSESADLTLSRGERLFQFADAELEVEIALREL